MIVYLYYQDAKVARYEADAVPPAGALVTFRMSKTQDRFQEGWLVCGTVSSDNPPEYDFDTLAPKLVVSITLHNVRECLE